MFAPRAPFSVNAPLCKSVETTRMSCELGEGRSSNESERDREGHTDIRTDPHRSLCRSIGADRLGQAALHLDSGVVCLPCRHVELQKIGESGKCSFKA